VSTLTRSTRRAGSGNSGTRRTGTKGKQNATGWLFTAPVLIILGLFLVLPVIMAAWVSISDWTGRGSPFSGSTHFVGAKNFEAVISGGGLAERDFGTALRNNLYYVVLVVPLQTMASLFLAVLVNSRILKGKGFFRTAFYFPSVTSSVAITVLWLFLFNATGAVNKFLSLLGITGPNWFQEPTGIIHLLARSVGIGSPPPAMESGTLLGVSWWDWLSGPSVAMSALILMAIFTTSGTLMLLFIAALQNLQGELEEASMLDGASVWQRFWYVTLPLLRPTLFTVITLGLIGSWQVFDQIYTGTEGGPAKTTITPAYLSFSTAFNNQQWGQGAAIAFLLFAIIIVFTVIQRLILRERDSVPRRKRMNPEPSPGRKL
jgi:multiple sugar transport system permease protein